MWEQIRANRRRSFILIWGMFLILAVLGWGLGAGIGGPQYGPIGVMVAAGIFLVQLLIYMAGAESVLLAGTGARELTRDDSPRLFNIVEEMKIASGLEHMPRIYLIDDPAPNAFAIGRKPEKAAIGVTSGLMYRLNRDELQGVIAHEIGHIKNMDVQFITLAAVTFGTIVIMADLV